ncbi:TetR/AcrR family transcriptional regulator [Nocardia sp. 348MFTsu5.1]|uniref:TetR/AcrR family transcriptional regulator n=1 Tax=Nocardia sp. 348MFTsu5.1 TaxID=1172185 RepID=UPI000377043B|nr:TetR/AcrR family transcriptional regulator [Nocardia sp. 348MFTsu5.1]
MSEAPNESPASRRSGRPTKPVVSRRSVIEAAVKIIDRDGLDAMSVRALGRELEVTSASLYYHFADKEEILSEVIKYILRRVRPSVPGDSEEVRSWQSYIVESVVNYRNAFIEHPNAAPLLITRPWRSFDHEVINTSIQALSDAGVHEQMQMSLIRSGEMLAFAGAIFSEYSDNDGFGDVSEEYPALRNAIANDAITDAESFELTMRALVTGFSAMIAMGPMADGPFRV